MALFVLDKTLQFPPVELSGPDGLLAIGGDLSPERLIAAYRNGIFPWYSEHYILWWSPDPRFVLFPGQLQVNRTMQKLLRKKPFRFSTNEAFGEVVRQCKIMKRKDQDGTWITDEMEAAYNQLHELGIAQSAEVWEGDQLVGGVYGLICGRVLFGESMFSHVNNASRYAFYSWVLQLREQGLALVDCQVHSPHLEKWGAVLIDRTDFQFFLSQFWEEPDIQKRVPR